MIPVGSYDMALKAIIPKTNLDGTSYNPLLGEVIIARDETTYPQVWRVVN